MSNTINKTFKKYRVSLETRCYSEVEVVCRDEEDLWNIIDRNVSYTDYSNNTVGMRVDTYRSVGDYDDTPLISVVREYQYDGEINSSIEEEEDLDVEFDRDDYNNYWDDDEDDEGSDYE